MISAHGLTKLNTYPYSASFGVAGPDGKTLLGAAAESKWKTLCSQAVGAKKIGGWKQADDAEKSLDALGSTTREKIAEAREISAPAMGNVSDSKSKNRGYRTDGTELRKGTKANLTEMKTERKNERKTATSMIKQMMKDLSRKIKTNLKNISKHYKRELVNAKATLNDEINYGRGGLVSVEKGNVTNMYKKEKDILAEETKLEQATERVATFPVKAVQTQSGMRNAIANRVTLLTREKWADVERQFAELYPKLEHKLDKAITKHKRTNEDRIPAEQKEEGEQVALELKRLKPMEWEQQSMIRGNRLSTAKKAMELLSSFSTVSSAVQTVLGIISVVESANERYKGVVPHMVGDRKDDLDNDLVDELEWATEALEKIDAGLERGTDADHATLVGKVDLVIKYVKGVAKDLNDHVANDMRGQSKVLDQLTDRAHAMVMGATEGSGGVGGVARDLLTKQESSAHMQQLQLQGVKKQVDDVVGEVRKEESEMGSKLHKRARDLRESFDKQSGKVNVQWDILRRARRSIEHAKADRMQAVLEAAEGINDKIDGVQNKENVKWQKVSGKMDAIMQNVGLATSPISKMSSLATRVSEMQNVQRPRIQREAASSKRHFDKAIEDITKSVTKDADSFAGKSSQWSTITDAAATEESSVAYQHFATLVQAIREEFAQGVERKVGQEIRPGVGTLRADITGYNEASTLEGRTLEDEDAAIATKRRRLKEQIDTMIKTHSDITSRWLHAQANIGPPAIVQAKQAVLNKIMNLGGDMDEYRRMKLLKYTQQYMASAKNDMSSVTDVMMAGTLAMEKLLAEERAVVEERTDEVEGRTEDYVQHSRDYSSEYETLGTTLEGGNTAFQHTLALFQGDTSHVNSLTRSGLVKMSEIAEAAITSENQDVVDGVARASGLTENQLHEMVNAGEALKTAIANGDTAAAEAAERNMRSLLEQATDNLDQQAKEAKGVNETVDHVNASWYKLMFDAETGLVQADETRQGEAQAAENSLARALEEQGWIMTIKDVGLAGLANQSTAASDTALQTAGTAGTKAGTEGRIVESGLRTKYKQLIAILMAGFAGQDENEKELLQAVGDSLGKVDDANYASELTRNKTRMYAETLEYTAAGEQKTADRIARDLRKDMGQASADVLYLLGQVTKQTLDDMYDVQKGSKKMRAEVEGFKRYTENMLDDPALHILDKVRDIDENALLAAENNERLKYWMDQFQAEASDWRLEVDSVIDDAEATLRKERAQIEASGGQQKTDAQSGAAALTAKLGKAVAGLGGTDIDSFGDDLAENADAMGNLNQVRAASDSQYLNNMAGGYSAQAQRASGDFDSAGNDLEGISDYFGTASAAIDKMKSKTETTQQLKEKALENEKEYLDDRMADFSHGMLNGTDSSAASGRTAMKWATSQLLAEGKQLLTEHDNLNTRHEAASNVIQSLFGKFTSIFAMPGLK
jgi:hypothetical protein